MDLQEWFHYIVSNQTAVFIIIPIPYPPIIPTKLLLSYLLARLAFWEPKILLGDAGCYNVEGNIKFSYILGKKALSSVGYYNSQRKPPLFGFLARLNNISEDTSLLVVFGNLAPYNFSWHS